MSTETDIENGMSSAHSDWPFIINLSNSIIGIAVLALPFCFKECGLILAMCLLLASAWITDVTCNMLMKLSAITKRRSYEYLALHVFGVFGKFTIEVSIIGLLIGTCVAFYIIIGDIAPEIVSNLTGLENTNGLRTVLLIAVTLLGVLPLGMMPNLDSLSHFSAVSLSFYGCFALHVVVSAFTNFFSGVWIRKIVYWNPDGLFKCLPIFALSYSCQTQLFILCDSLPEPSVKHMNVITRKAVVLVSCIYGVVGLFGYIAFYDHEITGDVLMNFQPTLFSELIKLGFVTSTIISFPLVIFPCRASIYTLLFAANSEDSEEPHTSSRSIDSSITIPSTYFKVITVMIVTFTLCIGIAVPNVEFMLAITGATMGSLICFIFPAVMSMTVASFGHGKKKLRAQFVLSVGIAILLASTYTTLSEQEKLAEESVVRVAQPIEHPEHKDAAKLVEHIDQDHGAKKIEHKDHEDLALPIEHVEKLAEQGEKEDQKNVPKPNPDKGHEKNDLAKPIKDEEFEDVVVNEPIPDKRQEPPNPREPLEHPVVPELLEKPSTHAAVDVVKKDDIKVEKNGDGVLPVTQRAIPVQLAVQVQHDAQVQHQVNVQAQPDVKEQPAADDHKTTSDKTSKTELNLAVGIPVVNNTHLAAVNQVIDSVDVKDAVKTREQLVKVNQGHKADNVNDKPIKADNEDTLAKNLLVVLQKQNEEQKQLLKEQRQIVDELKQHQIEIHKIDDKHWHQDAQHINISDSLSHKQSLT